MKVEGSPTEEANSVKGWNSMMSLGYQNKEMKSDAQLSKF